MSDHSMRKKHYATSCHTCFFNNRNNLSKTHFPLQALSCSHHTLHAATKFCNTWVKVHISFQAVEIINQTSMDIYTVSFNVSVPPDIIDVETSADMIVREGSNVTLKCSAAGSPKPSITWKREDSSGILLGNEQRGLSC